MGDYLRAAIRDGQAMRAARAARRRQVGGHQPFTSEAGQPPVGGGGGQEPEPTTVILCGVTSKEQARRMAVWLREQEELP